MFFNLAAFQPSSLDTGINRGLILLNAPEFIEPLLDKCFIVVTDYAMHRDRALSI